LGSQRVVPLEYIRQDPVAVEEERPRFLGTPRLERGVCYTRLIERERILRANIVGIQRDSFRPHGQRLLVPLESFTEPTAEGEVKSEVESSRCQATLILNVVRLEFQQHFIGPHPLSQQCECPLDKCLGPDQPRIVENSCIAVGRAQRQERSFVIGVGVPIRFAHADELVE